MQRLFLLTLPLLALLAGLALAWGAWSARRLPRLEVGTGAAGAPAAAAILALPGFEDGVPHELFHPSAEAPGGSTVCVCALAREVNGWCRACGVGSIGGLEVRSAVLYEALDPHGHEVERPRLSCASCQAAIEADGFCEACGLGFAGGLLHATRLAWALAVADRAPAVEGGCNACRDVPERVHWCDRCGRGRLDRFLFDDRAAWSRAAGDDRLLQSCIELAGRCETCATAKYMGTVCPFCEIDYGEEGRDSPPRH